MRRRVAAIEVAVPHLAGQGCGPSPQAEPYAEPQVVTAGAGLLQHRETRKAGNSLLGSESVANLLMIASKRRLSELN